MKRDPLSNLEAGIAAKLGDRRWRLSNLYWIEGEDEEGQRFKMKFRPNWAQEEVLDSIWWFNVILKARQLGLSTLFIILWLDEILFGKNLVAGIVDKSDADAVKKLKRVRYAYHHLDDPDDPATATIGALIKEAFPLLEENDHGIRFGGKSQGRFWAGSKLRGDTVQRLLISELGYVAANRPKDAEEIRSGSMNTVHKGNVIAVESTFEGVKSGVFYDILAEAMANVGKPREQMTELDPHFFFFPWHRHPEYRLDRSRDHEMTAKERKYFEELAKKGVRLDAGQRAWYLGKWRLNKEAVRKEFPSTPEEAMTSGMQNAIYGEEMARARSEGRISVFSAVPSRPLYVAWDLGFSDAAAMWLIQLVGLQIRILDYYSATGQSIGRYADKAREWETAHRQGIAMHLLPHDAAQHGRDGGTFIDSLAAAGITRVTVVPRTPDVWVGINAVIQLFPNFWIHSENCGHAIKEDGRNVLSGIDCLEGYRKRSESSHGAISNVPLHDACSHGADALRTFGEAWDRGLVSPEAAAPTPSGKRNKVRVVGLKTAGTASSYRKVEEVDDW